MTTPSHSKQDHSAEWITFGLCAVASLLLPKLGLVLGAIGIWRLIKIKENNNDTISFIMLLSGVVSLFLLLGTDCYEPKGYSPFDKGYLTPAEKEWFYKKYEEDRELEKPKELEEWEEDNRWNRR